MAQSRHPDRVGECPLSGVKRTSQLIAPCPLLTLSDSPDTSGYLVTYTASEAAFRGMNVIVPLDGISAENTYIEQYVAHNFTSAPGVAGKVTLTSVDMVKF